MIISHSKYLVVCPQNITTLTLLLTEQVFFLFFWQVIVLNCVKYELFALFVIWYSMQIDTLWKQNKIPYESCYLQLLHRSKEKLCQCRRNQWRRWVGLSWNSSTQTSFQISNQPNESLAAQGHTHTRAGKQINWNGKYIPGRWAHFCMSSSGNSLANMQSSTLPVTKYNERM